MTDMTAILSRAASTVEAPKALPPGDYLMAAVTDVEPGEWFDPEFLQQLRAASARVTLNEGDKKTQDLRLNVGG